MAWTFTVEDGTGLANSNSYVSVAACDDYHAAHLYATDWTGATNDRKQAALGMATRLIDAEFDFVGWKTKDSQALQWPRGLARNPDVFDGAVGMPLGMAGRYFPYDQVPVEVKNATCELARLLLAEDRTRNPDGEGVKSLKIYKGVEVEFNTTTMQPVIHRVVAAMLSKLGTPKDSGTRCVKLTRA